MRLVKPGISKIVSILVVAAIALVLSTALNISANPESTLLSYFSFDKLEGSIYSSDYTKNVGDYYHGLLFSGEGAVEEGLDQSGLPEGKYGSALSLDGLNSYAVIYPDIALTDPSVISASFFFRVDSLPETKQTIVQFLGDFIDEEDVFASAYLDSRGLVLNWLSDSGENEIISEFPVGEWVHASAVWNGDEVTLYINGEKKETKQSGKITAGGKYTIIGRDAKGNFFKGRIDEVKIYDGAISEEQAKDDFNGVKPEPHEEAAETSEEIPDNQLLANWDFEFIANNIVSDIINNNRGVLKGVEENKDNLITGKTGKALLLDGIDDRIEVSHTDKLSLSGSKSFTLSAWIKLTTPEFPEFQTIIRQRPDLYGTPWPYSLGLDKENKHVQFTIATGNKDVDRFVALGSKAEIPVGEWALVTAILGDG